MAIIPMPTDFPLSDYDNIVDAAAEYEARSRVGAQMTPESEAFFSSAYGLLYRWRALADADAAFVVAVDEDSHYPREAALFSFFVNALSSVEMACFGLYAFVAWLDPERFDCIKTRPKDITPGFVSTQFHSVFAKESLTAEIRSIVSSPLYKELADIRSRLSNCGTLRRGMLFSATVLPDGKQGTLPDTAHLNYSTLDGRRLEPTFTGDFRRRLATQMSTLLRAAHGYVHASLNSSLPARRRRAPRGAS